MTRTATSAKPILNARGCPSTRRIPVNYIMNLVIQTPWRSTQEAEGTPLERVQVVNSGARVQIPPSPSNPITFVIGFLFCPLAVSRSAAPPS